MTQDTEYYAAKHDYDHDAMRVRLVALEAAGKVRRDRRRNGYGRMDDFWEVTP